MHKNLCKSLLGVELHVPVKEWKLPKCPLIGGWLK